MAMHVLRIGLVIFLATFSLARAADETIPPQGSRTDDPGPTLVSPEAVPGAASRIKRLYDPIEFRADILPELVGREISRLRMFSLKDGRMSQIAFQIDEWTQDGHMILDQGESANHDQSNGLLDPWDEVVFMVRDTGARASREQWPAGVDTGTEIRIADPLTREDAWCYLLHHADAPPQSPVQNVKRVDETKEFVASGLTYRVYGTNHTRGRKVYRTIVNQHIWITPEAGGDGMDFIDRSKLRIFASMFFGAIKVDVDEDSIIGGVEKYKQGPVRSVARQWFGITMPMKLKSPKIYGDVYCYDTIILIAGQTNFPINPGYVLTEFRMTLGYDLHMPNAMGMLWYNSNNPDGFLVDGVTSPMESRFRPQPDDWRCVVGSNGWMVHRGRWDEEYSRQASISVIYRDDIRKDLPPEYYPGELGYYGVESVIKSLEARGYQYQFDWYWPDHFYSPKELRMDLVQEIKDIRDSPLEIIVGSARVINQAGKATLLEP